MSAALQDLIARQGGIFARRQAIAHGYTAKEFAWAIRRGGPWVRVRYGIYADRLHWETRTLTDRALLLDRAALIVCDAGTVLSHSSAARLWKLPLHGADDGFSHVTRIRLHDRRLTRLQANIKHHCGQLSDDEITVVDDLAVTTVVRTVLDVASEFGYLSGLVIADAALRRGLLQPDLIEELERFPHDSRARIRKAVAADADGRAESPLETLGRVLVKDMGITDVEPQHEVHLPDGGKAWVDLYSDRLHHCFECDGRLKYRPQVSIHGEVKDAADVVWDEKKREDALRGTGIGVSRLVWADTMPESFSRTSARLRREIQLQDAAGVRARRTHPV